MLEHNKCITTQFNRLRPLKKDSGYINIYEEQSPEINETKEE